MKTKIESKWTAEEKFLIERLRFTIQSAPLKAFKFAGTAGEGRAVWVINSDLYSNAHNLKDSQVDGLARSAHLLAGLLTFGHLVDSMENTRLLTDIRKCLMAKLNTRKMLAQGVR